MRVVLDTNTVISAIGWAGAPRQVLLALREDRHKLITSPALLEELTRVLGYPKLKPIRTHPLLPIILAWLHNPQHIVIPEEQITAIRADPADNLVLEAAVAGKADAIISGDQDLLDLRQFRGIQILTARRFMVRYLAPD